MASVGTLALFYPVFVPSAAAALAYGAHRATYVNWRALVTKFLTGPGRTSRILLLLFIATNWKTMPFGWTIRVFHTFLYHVFRRRQALPPRALFHYSISATRTTLLETDYNLHKSNSTYFADLDVARSHLVTHLLGPGLPIVADNTRNKLVLDKDGNLIKGGFGIGLGSVFCSFKKEISPLQKVETWSRVLAWDRKWLYLLTHFVVQGKVKPTGWDGRRAGPTRPRVVAMAGSDAEAPDFGKHVIATAVSKYVFKLGRFTIHPAIIIEANGLLPPRPGDGWKGGETGVGTPDDLSELDLENSEWDWKRVEYERRKGMEFAEHFAALDGTNALFDGAEDGALGRFPLG